MIYSTLKPAKLSLFLLLVLLSMQVSAQVSLVQNTINKLEGYKNFSYQSISKQKEFTSDTTISQYKHIFSKAPEDKNFGYLFSMETLEKADQSNWIDFYNGKNLIHLVPQDSTYEIYTIRTSEMQGTLLDRLKWIKNFQDKKPSRITQTDDTTINSISCSHLIANTYDTIINKQHYYTRINLFIDKALGVPVSILSISRNINIGEGVTNYYSEYRYFDYKFNQDNIDLASMKPPSGFHPHEDLPVVTVLDTGTAAPGWTLYDTEGKKISLAQMKGKVVLLDFFFIGCIPCMQALKPLNNLHEKYKNKDVVIASISDRDSREKVTTFKSKYHIKYPMYGDAVDVAKSYHVTAGPTFYFIDKNGKIANVNMGYAEDFEQKSASLIDNLLKK